MEIQEECVSPLSGFNYKENREGLIISTCVLHTLQERVFIDPSMTSFQHRLNAKHVPVRVSSYSY